MPRPRRSSVQRYHDRVAHRYDEIYDDVYWQWHDALTWDYIKPHLPRNLDARLADLGCGTGKWAEKLIRSGYHVTCIDIAQEMVDRARRKITSHEGETSPPSADPNVQTSKHGDGETSPSSADRSIQTSKQLEGEGSEQEGKGEAVGNDSAGTGGRRLRGEFVRADLCDMGMIADGSFALAVAMGDPICCTSSPAKAMKEIRRVLADHGMLIATFDNRLAAIDHYLEQGDPRELERFLRDGKTNWLTKDRDERFELHTFTPEDVRKLVERAGFEVIEMIGKTVLPMRHHRHLLEESESRRAWAKLEKSLCRDPAAIGRASHIQITCRKRPNG